MYEYAHRFEAPYLGEVAGKEYLKIGRNLAQGALPRIISRFPFYVKGSFFQDSPPKFDDLIELWKDIRANSKPGNQADTSTRKATTDINLNLWYGLRLAIAEVFAFNFLATRRRFDDSILVSAPALISAMDNHQARVGNPDIWVQRYRRKFGFGQHEEYSPPSAIALKEGPQHFALQEAVVFHPKEDEGSALKYWKERKRFTQQMFRGTHPRRAIEVAVNSLHQTPIHKPIINIGNVPLSLVTLTRISPPRKEQLQPIFSDISHVGQFNCDNLTTFILALAVEEIPQKPDWREYFTQVA